MVCMLLMLAGWLLLAPLLLTLRLRMLLTSVLIVIANEMDRLSAQKTLIEMHQLLHFDEKVFQPG